MPINIMPYAFLIETIRILDGTPRHLNYHQARLDDARRRLWGYGDALPLAPALQPPPEFAQGLVKCRLTYAYDIEKIEWAHYAPRHIGSLKLTPGDGLDYAFKYADRSAIAVLMQHRGEADDILILQNSLITDTSYCNVVLYDGLRYYTPATPLLAGTCRARLLDEGRIEPADIGPEKLKHFREIHLVNAMMDMGVCVLPTEKIGF